MGLVVEQAVAISGASAQSAAFSAGTRFLMIATDTACCLAFGNNPTAVTTAHRLSAGEVRFYTIQVGSKLAVIAGA